MKSLVSGLGWLFFIAIILNVVFGGDGDDNAISSTSSISSNTKTVSPVSAPQPPKPAIDRSNAPKSADTRPPAFHVYTTTSLRLREGPSTSHPILTTLAPSTQLSAMRRDNDWLLVITTKGQTGYVHSNYVSTTKPQPKAPVAAQTAQRSSSGRPVPIRDPYVGRCDCPYDYAKNGSICGRRSAYSRPGGRSPVCYK